MYSAQKVSLRLVGLITVKWFNSMFISLLMCSTCSFFTFFFGTGSTLFSDSERLRTERRCCFLSDITQTRRFSHIRYCKRHLNTIAKGSLTIPVDCSALSWSLQAEGDAARSSSLEHVSASALSLEPFVG